MDEPIIKIEHTPEKSLNDDLPTVNLSDTLSLIDDYPSTGDTNPNNDLSIITEAAIESLTDCNQESLDNTLISNFLPEETSINEEINDYKIGDIVWAKIGKYPFWPSIVCYDPKSKTFIKPSKDKRKFGLHVRFCNDKGRRNWIKTVEKYFGKEMLLSKYPNALSYIKHSKKLTVIWDLAVEEANNLLKLDREIRIPEFLKTFCDLENFNNFDCLTPSLINSENAASAVKVRTYSRKRSLTIPDQDLDYKMIKTENISVNGSTSSRSIDIPLILRSDDADSTVSDITMSHFFVEDIGLKMKNKNAKKRNSKKKTYPPKSSYNDRYGLSDSITSPEYSYDNSLLSDNQFITTSMTSNATRTVSENLKHQINTLEEEANEQNNKMSAYSRRSSKKIIISKSSSTKKTAKHKTQEKESIGRKSTTTKSESSPEPDTTGSEASSKNETYSSIFLASKKNRQLFVKSLKRACVVCKGVEDTIKCIGLCQSYFHEECLAKSEERYRKSEPKILTKKNNNSKKHYSKSLLKNGKTGSETSHIINTIEENIDELNEKDDNLVPTSLISTEPLSKEPSPDNTNEDQLQNHQLKFDEVSIIKPDVIIKNENKEGSSELISGSEEPIQELSEVKIDDTSIKPIFLTNDKEFKDDLKYKCSLCRANKTNCFVCGLGIDDSGQKIVCKLSSCGKSYHVKCLEDWPQSQWFPGSCNSAQRVICPQHVCHLCISDNPKSSNKTHFPSEKLIRCIKCPTTYHRSEYCLPAGSQVLSHCDIICSRHFEPPKGQNHHYNATWCFICTLGGSLICCDLCPSSFHIECLNQNPSEFENGFTCEECQTGRYPLYGEIVWVKVGHYRWWPAQIVFPNQVPDAVNAIKHSVGQFAVRFFGSYNYNWVNHGRVFNFHEGDDENMLIKNKMKVIDHVFQDAVIEAAQAHNAYILDKDKNDAKVSKLSLTKPPKFTRIKFNKPFGNVKSVETNSTTMTPCECDPTMSDPCGPDSDCLNRILMLECHPRLCPAGDKCNNQRFEKALYPTMVPFLTKGRGWGLKTLEDIKEGSFVIEYVGDVIDEVEFKKRCLEMQKRNEQNYYFLTIDNSRMIDAGPKGNLSRFMNHSCEPNCVTQKWTVNGDTRIGLFALHDILAGTELVFDYRLQSCSGVEKKPCQCGASRCSRFIGVKVDKEEEKKKIILINDVDKCKASTKNKRKPLKLKDNISYLEKTKLTKINNDQNVTTTENGIDSSDVKKIDDSKKTKTKVSIEKHSTTFKYENSESSDTHAVTKRKWRNSSCVSTNVTKVDNVDNSLEAEETTQSKKKVKNSLSTSSSRKQLIKKDAGLSQKSTELSEITPLFKEKSYISDLENIEDMKMTKASKNSTKDLLKTEPIQEKIEKNANVIKVNEFTVTKEKSRHSLTRLAKSRHSFLSKNDNIDKETNKQPNMSKRKFKNEKKKIVKVKKVQKQHVKIPLIKKTVVKKIKMNQNNSLSKNYYKNDSCLICGKGHAELSCKNKKCPRVFHLSCMNKSRIVKSGFICPSHFCSLCKKRKVVAKCKFCVESFCSEHIKGNIFKDPLGNGMLCITHHPNKKFIPATSTSVTPRSHSINDSNVNVSDKIEPVTFAGPSNSTTTTDILSPSNVNEDSFSIDTDEINKEEYSLTQVIKDECNREYIHIGGFNVCNMSDLVVGQEETYTAPVDTDGDLFKPSSANVVIDIESASALYQPTDSLQLVSIDTENKDTHDYANVHLVSDVNQTKNKWLAAEP